MTYLNNLFDQYQILTYLFYQNIYQLLFLNYHSINLFFFFILMILGFLTILTPCFISVLPLLFAYIYSNQNHKLNRYFFIIGIITSVFSLLCLSNFVNLYSLYNKLPILSALSLIFISLNLMHIIDFKFILSFIYSNINFTNNFHVNLQSYVVGLTIGISSIPCNTSIILFIVFLLKQLNSLSYLLFYLFAYILGCLLPLLLIIGVKINYKNFNALFQFWELIFPLSGSFLLCFSFLMLLRSTLL